MVGSPFITHYFKGARYLPLCLAFTVTLGMSLYKILPIFISWGLFEEGEAAPHHIVRHPS